MRSLNCIIATLAAWPLLATPILAQSKNQLNVRWDKKDPYGDPLPPWAVARIGTLRLNHAGDLAALAFSKDEKRLFSAGARGVRVWDVETGKEIGYLPFKRGSATCLRVSEDGKLLIVGGNRGGVMVYELPALKENAYFFELKSGVADVACSKDASTIYGVDSQANVAAWDLKTGKRLFFKEGPPWARQVQIIIDPLRIYVHQWGVGVVEWSILEKGDVARQLIATKDWPTQGTMFHNNELFFFKWYGLEGTKCAPADVGKEPETYLFKAKVLAANGGLMAGADEEGWVYLFKQGATKPIKKWRHWPRASALALSPGARYCASGTERGTISIWALREGDRDLHFPGFHGGTLTSSFVDPKTICSLRDRGDALYFDDVTSQKTVKLVEFEEPHRVWMAPGGRFYGLWRRKQVIDLGELGGSQKVAIAWNYDLTMQHFHPNGREFVCNPGSGWLTFWKVGDAKPRLHFKTPVARYIRTAGFTGDGKTLVMGGRDGCLVAFDWQTGKELSSHHVPELKKRRQDISCLLPSPEKDKVHVASGGTVLLWDVAKGTISRRFETYRDDQIDLLALRPGGDVLAGASKYHGGHDWSSGVTFWDAATGDKLYNLRTHIAGIRSLQFSPDGKYLATAGTDNTLLIWDTDLFLGKHNRE